MTATLGPGKLGPSIMVNIKRPPARITVALLLTLGALISCGDSLDTSFPPPEIPFDATLYDLIAGPIDRSSAFDVVAAQGLNLPRTVRVDQTENWDIAFAAIEGEPFFLPRGFFETLAPSAGILEMQGDFENITLLPGDSEFYEYEEPVPVNPGSTYAIRSRPNPTLSLPCHIFLKLVVDSVGGDPMRISFRFLWNPNCDDTNVASGDGT